MRQACKMLRLHFVPLSMTVGDASSALRSAQHDSRDASSALRPADGRLQFFTPLHCLLAEEAALQLIDEGAEGDEGALLFVAGERTTAGVERTEAVAEHHGEGQADVADMIDFSLKGMEALSVDPYFDSVLFFMVVMF